MNSLYSAVIKGYGLEFLEFQEIRLSLSLQAHYRIPGHLIVGIASLSREARQPALPHYGLRCYPCQTNEDGSLCSNLAIYHCQVLLLASRDWLRQRTFSGSKCYLGLIVDHVNYGRI